MEVMGGKAVNGWRFWTVKGDAQPASATPANKKSGGSKARTFKLFKRLPGTGLEEGQQRFWCQACQKSFVTSDTDPEACPEGHRNDDLELARPAAEATAADKAEAAE